MKTNLSIWLIIAGLIVGIFGGAIFFPVEKTVEVERNVTIEVPVNVTKLVEVPVAVEVFGYKNFVDASWAIVLDEFENELETCEEVNYDIDDEVEFEVSEDATFGSIDWDKGKFTLTFEVEAEYDDGDDECEQTFTVSHDFKNFEPRDEDYADLEIVV